MSDRTPAAGPPRLVAYYRVSTAKQGESGLGLEGQVAAVEAFAAGLGAVVVAAYEEVETGKRADRPELAKALAHARLARARLVIAKLDRLARNVHFTSGLMESGVDFVACDNPHANRLTIHILAAVAEDEARRISERTKAALAAYKASGRVSRRLRLLHPGGVPPEVAAAAAGRLGAGLPQCRSLTPEGRALGRARAAESRSAAAVAAYAHLVGAMRGMRAEGLSLRAVAARLDALGHSTRRGRPWNAAQVKRVLDRASAAPRIDSMTRSS